jgi:hypothetical protein
MPRKPRPAKKKTGAPKAEALRELQKFSLLDALFGRRSRRFGVGMEIPDGPFAYRSKHPPEPIGDFERTLLIAIGAGVSGWNLGIPHAAHCAGESGCDYPVRPVGRTYPSGAAVYGSELLITDDSGSYITKFRDLNPTAIREANSPEVLVARLQEHIIRLSTVRVHLPSEFPHVGTHNQWVANRPGSTLFVPISDQVETLLNLLWIYTGEGSPVLDAKGKPFGEPKPLLKDGLLHKERAIPLSVVEAVALKHTTSEITIAAYNIQLALQGIGLGGWLYTGINSASLLGAYAKEGTPGFGFRYQRNSDTPEDSIPLGLDGAFEPLVPPYVEHMAGAAKRFLERKFGERGVFGAKRPSPFLRDGEVKKSLAAPSPAVADYFVGLVQDIFARFGRFPATIAPVGAGLYTQAQHIDTDFYDKFYKNGAYLESHARHNELWHSEE